MVTFACYLNHKQEAITQFIDVYSVKLGDVFFFFFFFFEEKCVGFVVQKLPNFL